MQSSPPVTKEHITVSGPVGTCDAGRFSDTVETKTNTCQICIAGKYSLKAASTICEECQTGEKQGSSQAVVLCHFITWFTMFPDAPTRI